MASQKQMPYQYRAINTRIAELVASYLVNRLNFNQSDVEVSGVRVLHSKPIRAAAELRLRGYVDGLEDGFVGSD